MADIIRTLIEIFLCIFLPPLAIFFHGGVCDRHVIVNIILCLFVWIPAVIHSFWYCFVRDSNPTI